MFFGFYKEQEFVPEIYKSYNREKINYIFLCQYNANVENELKIPLSYAQEAKNLKELFILYLDDIFNKAKFAKPKKICSQLNLHAKAFKQRESLNSFSFGNSRVEKLLSCYFNGLLFQTQDLFLGYVYDKISKQNPQKKIFLKDNFINIENKIGILVFSEKIDIQKIQIQNELDKALKFIEKHSFTNFFILYPRNKNFTHFLEIKHFICNLNKTMLKLVPYSISNKLIRRF